MDEGFPQSSWQGDDRCEYDNVYRVPVLVMIACWMFSGCYNRFREAQKCPGPLRSRAGADYDQGDETSWRDQATPGTCILEAKVGFSRLLDHSSTHLRVGQNGGCSGKTTCPPGQKAGSQVDVRQTCGATGCGIYIHRERAGKDQSTEQEPECPHYGRWSIHGYGCRLTFAPLSMYCCSRARRDYFAH